MVPPHTGALNLTGDQAAALARAQNEGEMREIIDVDDFDLN
ncbi:hypothetical protein ACFV1L_21345 [Kitasatospora sp. NPDC059646]